uniref:Uncharacterized protein n=1 Tax=Anguilla anguilla TaxID=7936 RepID=A0A0E9S3A7_ANGAN
MTIVLLSHRDRWF